MALLFKINKRNNVVFHPDALKIVPSFKRLNQDEMAFLVLYCDYHSPIHQFPPNERLPKAKRMVWGKGDHRLKKGFKNQMEEYMTLQYDPKREIIKAYQAKIELFKTDLIKETDTTKVNNMLISISKLEAECEKMEHKIAFEDEKIEIEGGRKQSFLETLQYNKKLAKMKDVNFPDLDIIYDPKETGNEGAVTDYSVGQADS